jgi:hypothetical protein
LAEYALTGFQRNAHILSEVLEGLGQAGEVNTLMAA